MCRVFPWVLPAVLAAPALVAATYSWTPGLDVVGSERYVKARKEETLLDLARRYGYGSDELRMANPSVDFWLPGAGTSVMLPGRHVLPAGPRKGIVINLDEMRLYYFPEPADARAGRTVITYPISVGRDGLGTPLGTTSVTEKVNNPTWYPGETSRAEHAQRGEPLPKAVPPGPDNPLGPFAMKLGFPGILIHGTNKPYGIGMPVTHGCIRLYPEDIKALMPLVPRGTPVHTVRQQWKLGWRRDVLYFETHLPRSKNPHDDFETLEPLIGKALAGRPDYVVDWPAVEAALMRPRGVPQPVWRKIANEG